MYRGDPGGPPKRVSGVDVAPALARQLALTADTERVAAVLVLRHSAADRHQRSDPETLLRHVARNAPVGAVEYTLLLRLGVLIVRAPARVIRGLIAQPAVVIASANRIAGTATERQGSQQVAEATHDQHEGTTSLPGESTRGLFGAAGRHVSMPHNALALFSSAYTAQRPVAPGTRQSGSQAGHGASGGFSRWRCRAPRTASIVHDDTCVWACA